MRCAACPRRYGRESPARRRGRVGIPPSGGGAAPRHASAKGRAWPPADEAGERLRRAAARRAGRNRWVLGGRAGSGPAPHSRLLGPESAEPGGGGGTLPTRAFPERRARDGGCKRLSAGPPALPAGGRQTALGAAVRAAGGRGDASER